MDKLTRLLWLYSKLLNGEEVNKWSFCLEADCQSRSFDRDIEDIRMFLSETYQVANLLYSRSENTYYLTAGQRQPLEMMEYWELSVCPTMRSRKMQVRMSFRIFSFCRSVTVLSTANRNGCSWAKLKMVLPSISISWTTPKWCWVS